MLGFFPSFFVEVVMLECFLESRFLSLKFYFYFFSFYQPFTKNLNCFQPQKTKLRTEPRQEEFSYRQLQQW